MPAFKTTADGTLVVDPHGNPVYDEQQRDGHTVKRYRPRVEGLFGRIERWTRVNDGDTHWRSISKDNVLTTYGSTSQSRIADPASPNRVFQWLICESHDDKGNAIVYEYAAESDEQIDPIRPSERNRRPTANRIRSVYRPSRSGLADLLRAGAGAQRRWKAGCGLVRGQSAAKS